MEFVWVSGNCFEMGEPLAVAIFNDYIIRKESIIVLKKAAFLILAVLIMLYASFTIQAEEKKPLSIEDIDDLLRNFVSNKRVSDLITEYGIRFEKTEENIGKLKAAGADETIFEALNKEWEKKEPKAGDIWRDPVMEMEFVFIKGGCFEMGDNFGDGNEDERPVHEICVDDFWMGKYEVRVGEFRKFVNDMSYRAEAERVDGCFYWTGSKWEKDKGRNWRDPGFQSDDRHPVVCVSWNDAVTFARWLEGKTGKKYRLPTEAEWEYAARSGGKKYKYSWGNGQPSGNIADVSAKRKFPAWTIWEGYDDGYVFTSPVGTYKPNELGLYDMTGNVWQWCQDWYDKNYYTYSQSINPEGPSYGQYRVSRGSNWSASPRQVRASTRVWVAPMLSVYSLGFRLVLPVKYYREQ